MASIVINLDLPWNPAILEQRVGRIYRIGQEMPIQVMNLVSKGSIEESMIDRLRFKRSMFEGALDGGDDTIFLSEDRFKGFMESLSDLTNLSPTLTEGEEVLPPEMPSDGQPLTPPVEATGETVTTFLTSLREILQSPEKTKQLAEAITQILSPSSDL